MSKTCPRCGGMMNDADRFCPSCGASANAQPSAIHRKLVYGIGAATAVLLLAVGGYWGYHAADGSGKAPSPESQENATIAKGQGMSLPDLDAAGRKKLAENSSGADPIRANIVSGKSTVASQMDESHLQKALELIKGDWYDETGEKLVTIRDRSINGCEVVAAYDFAGGGGHAAGTFRLRENGSEWDVRIGWNISRSSGDAITVNGNQTLHKTLERDGESIGGIYLGMTPDQVKKKLGEPTQVMDKDHPLQIGSEKHYAGWYYQGKGLVVKFSSGSTDSITLLKQSDLRLEKSGLTCADPPEAFAKAYSMQRMPKWPDSDYNGPNPIGNGEYIFFGKDMESITLSIYAT